MYPPPHHQSDDIEKMISVIKHFPLGMLVTAKDGKPFITHIPFIYNETSKKTGRTHRPKQSTNGNATE